MKAILSLVPTPSALATSSRPGVEVKRPPNEPNEEDTAAVFVPSTSAEIRAFARRAASRSTPESA